MIPIPANIPTWAIKGGAVLLFLSLVFYSGCYTQKQFTAAKIQKMKANYDRCVEIVDVFQDNYDTIEKGLQDQNEAIEELGRESLRKIESLKEAHSKAITKLEKRNTRILRNADKEAEDLRKRLAKLSVAEACHEAWVEMTK